MKPGFNHQIEKEGKEEEGDGGREGGKDCEREVCGEGEHRSRNEGQFCSPHGNKETRENERVKIPIAPSKEAFMAQLSSPTFHLPKVPSFPLPW